MIKKEDLFLIELGYRKNSQKRDLPMNQFTTELVDALVKKQDITEVFRTHLETAVNTLLATELTFFLDF